MSRLKFINLTEQDYNNKEVKSLYDLISEINSNNNENIEIYMTKYGKPKFVIGVAYNEDTGIFRFASYSFKNNIDKSPVYYYDIKEESLGLKKNGKYNFHNIIVHVMNKLNFRDSKKNVQIEENKDMNKFIDFIKSIDKGGINTELHTFGICDLVLCQGLTYFGDNPYLEYHTGQIMTSDNWDYRANAFKIVSLISDKEGNIKNVELDDLFAGKSLEERQELCKDKKEEFLNIVK